MQASDASAEEFLAQAHATSAEGGSIFLRRVEWPRDSLSPHLVFESPASGHDPEGRALSDGQEIAWRWRVECDGAESWRVEAHEIGRGSLQMPREHPFLWRLASNTRSLHFQNKPRDTDALIGALLRTHQEATRGLLPFPSLLNCGSVPGLVALLEGGHGLLARGPEPLMRAYIAEIEKQGCRASLIGGTEPFAEPAESYLGYELLLWERTSFVIAEQFRFKREA